MVEENKNLTCAKWVPFVLVLGMSIQMLTSETPLNITILGVFTFGIAILARIINSWSVSNEKT